MDQNEDQSYEFKLRILGNEVIGIVLTTTSTSSKWIAISIVSIFSLLFFLGMYGDNLVRFYKSVAG